MCFFLCGCAAVRALRCCARVTQRFGGLPRKHGEGQKLARLDVAVSDMIILFGRFVPPLVL